jgi:hypothetical protein
MMIFKLLSFLFVPYNNLLKDTNKSIKSIYDGYDCRFINSSVTLVNDEQLMVKMRENYERKKKLDKLQSHTSIINKVIIAENFLNENVTYGYNIYAGGLFKDWDFEI